MKYLSLLLCCLTFSPALAQPLYRQDHAPIASSTSNEALAVEIIHHIGLVSQRDNHFRETRQLHALKQPLHSEGLLRFVPPDHIEKYTLTPVQDHFILEGDMVQLQHGQSPMRSIPLHINPTMQIMAATIRGPLQGDVTLLQTYYNLSAQGDMGHWTLLLTPRTSEVAQIIQRVQLEGRNNVLERTRLIQANGDSTETIITPQ
ncbi:MULTISPECIES: LolA-related protein [Bombella]|uniref:Outer membrane lipoprotein carrier protein LolA n=1 Tax=Bombella pollinis TaxID=2967337 RepID=A0ABT3WIS8_9PROT|nr:MULTISPECIES: LolA-related protein [Bombella]MCX5619002.1 hypothetical protein [Bombella pollinis]MUG89475.1 hypothetical protein [Bombella sp. ESL0385]